MNPAHRVAIVAIGKWLLAVCSILALGSAVGGCKQKDSAGGTAGNAINAPTQQSAEPGYFKTHFQTEAQFVVETVAADIAEMAWFAQRRGLPDTNVFSVNAQEVAGTVDAPVYRVTVTFPDKAPIQTTVNVSGPIWSERIYADLTAAIAEGAWLKSPSSKPNNDTTMLTYLSDGLAESIEQENLELSENLEKDFTNPALHEQAAALLGAFALRENSAQFQDIRMALCRMTAHMALARFLAGKNPPGINGQVADCMSLTLMNDEVAALEQLKKMDTKDKAVAAWVRVLGAHASRDFRPLNYSEFAQGIERVAWFWAYSAASSRAVAWEKAGTNVAEIPDYSRIAGAMGYSVQMGNVMLQAWLPLEFKEIGDIYKLSHGRALDEKDMVEALNAAPDRCFKPGGDDPPRISVIGWGLWALQLQRHLCHAINIDYHSLKDRQGLPEEAQQFAEQYNSQLGGLRLYAFLRRMNCTNDVSYRAATDEGWVFFTQFPHLTPLVWLQYLSGGVSFAPRYRPLPNPHCNEWTVHNPLPGTAYDVDARLGLPSLVGGYGAGSGDQILKVHKMAPYDIEIDRYIGRTFYTTNWTYEAAMSTFGLLQPYSALASAAIADSIADQPEKYEKLMEHASEMDPSFYYNLGDYEWQRGQTNEAFIVYEKAVDKDPDALSAARYAPFLIDHYLATGDQEKARKMADLAGDVYSASGLAAKAGYFEKTGELSQALEWFDKITERYGTSNEAFEFCRRHMPPTGNAKADQEITAHMKNWLDAQKKVTLAELTGPPGDGVILEGKQGAPNDTPLASGDIVVGVRGIRVHNTEQLTIARDMEASAKVTVIVWRGGGYQEFTVTLPPNHRFGFGIQNYSRN
jgi:tetratricopeptide (TPR) repeat protein